MFSVNDEQEAHVNVQMMFSHETILLFFFSMGETVETGDRGLNKQFAWYPLTVEGKVAMLRVEKREERRKEAKNEIKGHRMLSAGKQFLPEMLPSIKIQTARQIFQGLEH